MSNSKTQVVKDLKEKTILVSREFNAPVANVWRCYTESDLLDKWWGPSPWHTETKTMDFKPGGQWLYAMVGPNGEKHWSFMNYLEIEKHKSFSIEDGFCDENGVVNKAFPVSKGANVFTPTAGGTLVEFRMRYPSEADLQKIIDMGFEEGIKICIEQLDKLLLSKEFAKAERA